MPIIYRLIGSSLKCSYICVCNRDSVDTHYDPSREDHAKFEEEIRIPKRPERNNENNMADDVPAVNEHVVTQEKFYCVSESLKGFFGNKDKVLYGSS